ncbi:hypothetical protein N8Z04_01480, partial [bacterium]|nr:hypothetical protein [bacterium]
TTQKLFMSFRKIFLLKVELVVLFEMVLVLRAFVQVVGFRLIQVLSSNPMVVGSNSNAVGLS